MNFNKTIKKELDKISSNVKKLYGLDISKTHLLIHSPSYINIHYDRNFNVSVDEYAVTIKNKKISVTLWINSSIMHTTVFN